MTDERLSVSEVSWLSVLIRERGVSPVLAAISLITQNNQAPASVAAPIRRGPGRPKKRIRRGATRMITKAIVDRALVLRKQGNKWEQVSQQLRFHTTSLMRAVKRQQQEDGKKQTS